MTGALIVSIIASVVAAAATKFFFLMRFLASLSELCVTENLARATDPLSLAYYIAPPPSDLGHRQPAGRRSEGPHCRVPALADASGPTAPPRSVTCCWPGSRAASPVPRGCHSPDRRQQRLFRLVFSDERL